MRCPSCQFENRAGAKFCLECGEKLEMKCPGCGKALPPQAKFCDECGHDLKKPTEAPPIDYSEPQSYTPKFLADKILTTRSSVEGERKLVTVLFADVANYTAIAEKLDPEEVHQIMDGCFKILMDEIHKYEGTINQFTGDGVMALFGTPVAHEDHAQRACFAALGIQRAMDGFSRKLREEKDIDFKLRIGLNTGSVVVGTIGDDLRMDYTALGDTTNLAARMQQTAEPGQIRITDLTYRSISDHFVSESLGKLQVKGKEEPVVTHLLKRTRGIRTRMDIAAEKGLSPLTGRSEELSRIHQLWELSKKGQGQVVFVVGEAGIGKSRLVFEFHRSLADEDMTWLEGHGTTYGGNMPFLPLIDLLKRNFRIEERDSEEIIIQKIEEGMGALGEEVKDRTPHIKFLLSVDPGHALLALMDPYRRRRMIFDSIRLMAVQGSKLRPLVLVLEDLHWMDSDTEEFLRYAIDSIATLPVMLILTYRPGYSNPFGERTFYNRISLKALEKEESLNLAKGVIGAEQLPESIRPLIVDRAEGNPFYIEEITKSVVETGAIKRVETADLARDLYQIQIPMSIQEVLAARIDRLPEEQKNALQIASVIGREFTSRLLERIAGLEDKAQVVLGELVSLELIYQTEFYPELTYMFKHSLTHEAVYNSLLSSKQKIVHASVGNLVEALYSMRLAELYETLAYHYERGEVWDKAVHYLILSGEKALGNMANPSAHGFFAKAIDIRTQPGASLLPEQEYAIYQGRGNSEFNMGHFVEAERDFAQAREIARGFGDQNMEAEALSMAAWSLGSLKRYEEAANIYREAIDLGRQISNPMIEGRNLCGLALLNISVFGDVHEGLGLIEKALEIGKTTNSIPLLIFAQSMKAFAGPFFGDPTEEAIEFLNRHIKTLQMARQCVFIYNVLSYDKACRGDYEGSIATFKEGISLAEETGEALNRAKAFNWLAWVYSDLGWISEAKRLNEQSYKEALTILPGSEEVVANAVVDLAELAVRSGDLETAEEHLNELMRKAEADPKHWLTCKTRWEVRFLCTSGEILLNRGETEEAKRCAGSAFDMAETTLNKRGIIRANRLMGEICIARKEFSEAQEKLHDSLIKAKELENPPHLWRTYFALGQLKEAQGLYSEAKKRYREALDVTDRLARTLIDKSLRNIFLNSDQVVRIRDSLQRVQ